MEKVLAECRACQGSGVFKGVYERGKTAIVCRECEGDGSIVIQYKPFVGKQTRSDVNRVFMRSGHVIDNYIHGGVPYQEWLEDNKLVYKPESALRELHCPRLYANHTPHDIFDERIALWDKCDEAVLWGKSVYDCPHFCDKAECWKQFDEEVKELE